MSDAEVKNIPFNASKQLTINGVPDDSFTINVGKSKDIIGLKYEVRFGKANEQSVIIMSCIKDGVVLHTQTETSFPFQKSRSFEVSISFGKDNFQIKINSHVMYFSNSLDAQDYDYIWSHGKVSIEGISIN
uniref:Galectin n=1 Tax=Conger myriaster TaxID=7943 RepID=Q76CY7_CONMY|nr:galectin [Conger myriaster]